VATFYYDESNNHRKLWIDPERRAYNIDKDTQRKIPVGRNFVLGGVMHYGANSSADVPALIASLNLDKNLKEVKFKHIATGDFDCCLKSQRVENLLKWVINSDLYIHFFNINLEYWAFIDIVDDCLLWCHETGANFELRSLREPDEFKDALYRVIRMGRASFLDLAYSFGYPNLEGKTDAFIAGLADHVRSVLDSPDYQDELDEVGLREVVVRLLELLEVSKGIDDMTLVQMDGDGMLVDAFTPFYNFTAETRSKDDLIMDMEVHVKDHFDSWPTKLNTRLNLRFVDSKDEPLVRVSDLVTGLIARCLQFVDDHSHQHLGEWLGRLNPQQTDNLALLKMLVDKSDNRDPMLLHRVVANSEKTKFELILYPEHFHTLV